MGPLLPEDLDHVLAHTRELWPEARRASFFITGGTGFFGTWLLESFAWVNDSLALDMQATVLTRSPERFAAKAPHLASRSDLRLVRGDIRTFSDPGGSFDYIVHAAADVNAVLSPPAAMEAVDTIVGGTQRMLAFAGRAAARKFLFTSSGAVYGRQPPELTHISEDFAGGPEPSSHSSTYGESKRMAEQLCAIYSARHGFEAKIARCFAFVGPQLPIDAHFAVGNFVRDALAGGPIRVAGDGTPWRSYLYGADLAIWLWTILFKGQSLRPYNVGSGDALTIAQLAAQVAARQSPRLAVVVAESARPGASPNRYVPSVDRACRELELRVRVDLAEGLVRTFNWHLRKPANL